MEPRPSGPKLEQERGLVNIGLLTGLMLVWGAMPFIMVDIKSTVLTVQPIFMTFVGVWNIVVSSVLPWRLAPPLSRDIVLVFISLSTVSISLLCC